MAVKIDPLLREFTQENRHVNAKSYKCIVQTDLLA